MNYDRSVTIGIIFRKIGDLHRLGTYATAMLHIRRCPRLIAQKDCRLPTSRCRDRYQVRLATRRPVARAIPQFALAATGDLLIPLLAAYSKFRANHIPSFGFHRTTRKISGLRSFSSRGRELQRGELEVQREIDSGKTFTINTVILLTFRGLWLWTDGIEPGIVRGEATRQSPVNLSYVR